MLTECRKRLSGKRGEDLAGEVKRTRQEARFADCPVVSCRPITTSRFDPFATVRGFVIGGSTAGQPAVLDVSDPASERDVRSESEKVAFCEGHELGRAVLWAGAVLWQ